jgi:hypothetical protein
VYVYVHAFIHTCVHPLQLLNQFIDIHKTWSEHHATGDHPKALSINSLQSLTTMQMHKVMKWEQHALPFT